jgi:predicted neutral ceramidase superfamily lipid hydrolase
MEPSSIGILIVALVLILEIVVMLVKFKVDKMLLLLPVIGVLLVIISFVLNVYRETVLASVAGAAPYIVYLILASGVLLGFVSFLVWFKGEKEARKLASTVKSIDSAVSGIESDLRGSRMELEHFEEEMSAIKTKIQDYETKEKGV